MATPFIQTPYEAERLWATAYQGKKARLCLANNPGTLTASSTTAQWDAVELTGNGYARSEWTIPAGTYNTTSERFQAPVQLAEFQAGTSVMSWNTAYLVFGTISGSTTTWNTGVSYILNESPTVSLYPGEGRGYNILLFTDGFLVTS